MENDFDLPLFDSLIGKPTLRGSTGLTMREIGVLQ